jgi:hypothetical protein
VAFILPCGYLSVYFASWFCVSFRSKNIAALTSKYILGRTHTHTHRYEISGIPALIVINPDGTLVTKEGRNDVMQAGFNVMNRW